MTTPPTDKKIVAALGIAVGAGIALTCFYRGSSKTVRVLHLPNTHPQWKQLAVSSFPAQIQAPEEVPVQCAVPTDDPTPAAVESITPRWSAGALDTLIVLLASCIFVGISLVLSVNVPIDRFDVVMLTCSFVLIATFYDFLFKTAGCGTPGEMWQKASHFG